MARSTKRHALTDGRIDVVFTSGDAEQHDQRDESGAALDHWSMILDFRESRAEVQQHS